MPEVLKRLWAVYSSWASQITSCRPSLSPFMLSQMYGKRHMRLFLELAERQLQEDQPLNAGFPCLLSNSGKPDMPSFFSPLCVVCKCTRGTMWHV